MIAVNATSLSHTTGAIKSPMGSAPQPCTALHLGLLTTGNGCSEAGSGFARVARSSSNQPVASPFETSATPQEKAANLLRRHEDYQTVRAPSGKFLSELPLGAQANICGLLLAKDTLHFYVEECLKTQGMNTTDLHESIDSLVEKLLVASPALDAVKVVQRLVEKIPRDRHTPQTVIERFPVKDYKRAAEHQQGASSQTAGGEQRMEALSRLLLSWAQPMHRVGISEHHAGKAMAAPQISQPIQDVVHQDLVAPVPRLSPLPQARAGALTDEGHRKTIANQLRPAFGLPGLWQATCLPPLMLPMTWVVKVTVFSTAFKRRGRVWRRHALR